MHFYRICEEGGPRLGQLRRSLNRAPVTMARCAFSSDEKAIECAVEGAIAATEGAVDAIACGMNGQESFAEKVRSPPESAEPTCCATEPISQ